MKANLFWAVPLSAALGLFAPSASVAAPLASHFAVYDLSLASVARNSDVADFVGRMVFDFRGSRCKGFTTQLRFVTQLADGEGNRVVTDTQAQSVESGDGAKYEFNNRTYVDGALDAEAEGTAERRGRSAVIRLKKPETASINVARDIHFPTAHLDTILAAARSGQTFVAVDMFDGAETGRIVYATTAVVSPMKPGREGGDLGEAKAAGVPAGPSWRVTVGYFSSDKAEGETMPEYTLSFVLHDNGVTRDLRLDYGDFVVSGRLTKLKIFDPEPCR